MTVMSARPASVSHSEVDSDAGAVRLVGEPDASTTPLLLAVAKTLLNAEVGAHTPRHGRTRGGRV
jgi:hypothetical protein